MKKLAIANFAASGLFVLMASCGGGDDHAHGGAPFAGTLEARKNVPAEYKDLKNPLEVTPENLAAGKAQYDITCGTCHGPTGHGDGAVGKSLNPPPAHLSHAEIQDNITDGYIFWRSKVGPAPVPGSGMTPYPDWDDKTRWQVVMYIRSLKGK